jgi:ubiquinone/menaquinone biosynthesis C-methylase UbiE
VSQAAGIAWRSEPEGRGSIAAWLSERVGPTGQVIATDIGTRFLETLQRPNLEVRRHNIVTDPLPEDEFDLVHVRLVLMHLPERDSVLRRSHQSAQARRIAYRRGV